MNFHTKIKEYFSIKQMKKEIYGYGYTVSNIKYLIFLGCAFIFLIAIGVLYQMKWGYILSCLGICALFVPALAKAKFKALYQKKRFNEVDIYLHQMIYSFQKKPKIITALQDTEVVATGKLKKALNNAILCLNTSVSINPFEDALRIIEKEYNNTRVKALNKYLINIELHGGEYQSSINIMLTDIDNWITRTYIDQDDVEKVKRTNIIGLAIGLGLGGVSSLFSIFLNNSEFGMNKSIASDGMYQFECLAFIIVCIFYFVYTQVSYNSDWVEKTISGPLVMKHYKHATEFNPTHFRIISIPIYVFFFIASVLLFFLDFIPYNEIASISVLGIDIYLIIQPSLTKKAAVNITKRNIQESFSEWLRDVSLNLQEKPLLSSIQDTYDTCPVVLKPELEIFLKRLEQDPSDVEPYYEFLARFHLLDISSAVRNLYSLSDTSGKDLDKQLSLLIERNYEIINRNEIIASRDRSVALHFTENIPMGIASLKLGLDIFALMGIML